MKYLIDTHTHTIASGHAYNTIDEMAAYAASLGVIGMAITEHAPAMPGSVSALYFANLKVVPKIKSGVKMYYGSEVNIIDLDGNIDLGDYGIQSCDIVIASFHIPCIRPGTLEENTAAVLKVMDNPFVDIIGHPDDARYPLDYEAVVKAAKEKHKLLELNNHSLRPTGPRKGAYENDRMMLELCKKYNVCISLGSDAHVKEDICNFELACQLLEETDFPDRLIVNTDLDLLESYIRFGKK